MDINKELYKASLPAFFANELANDRVIIYLSLVGVVGHSIAGVGLASLIALFSFYITIILVLGVFYLNRVQFLRIIGAGGLADELPTLVLLDKIKYLPLVIAIIATGLSY